jgi:hypothetical protein
MSTGPVYFTQHHLPNGRQSRVYILVPISTAKVAQILTREHNCKFEIETLRTGQISITCEHEGAPIAWEICADDLSVPDAVEKLISTAALCFDVTA